MNNSRILFEYSDVACYEVLWWSELYITRVLLEFCCCNDDVRAYNTTFLGDLEYGCGNGLTRL